MISAMFLNPKMRVVHLFPQVPIGIAEVTRIAAQKTFCAGRVIFASARSACAISATIASWLESSL